MNTKAKERRAALDQVLTARANVAPTERPAVTARQLGPIAEQASIYAEHVATRAKLYDDAKAQGRLLVELDPKTIRPTRYRNRHDRSLLMTDPAFATLKNSLHRDGQDTPIRVRPLKDALPFEYEICAGHRRHAACLLLDTEIAGGWKVMSIVDPAVQDARAFVLKMFRENDRADLSAYETGAMFARWLDEGIFGSQREIAAAVGLGESAVAKYLAVATLPGPVLAAFGDERTIQMTWGSALSQAIKTDETAVLKAAERAAQRRPPHPTPDLVFKSLVSAATGKTPSTRGTSREESVRIGGRVPLKVGIGRNRIILKLQHLDDATQKQLREELKDWAEAWLRKKLDGT